MELDCGRSRLTCARLASALPLQISMLVQKLIAPIENHCGYPRYPANPQGFGIALNKRLNHAEFRNGHGHPSGPALLSRGQQAMLGNPAVRSLWRERATTLPRKVLAIPALCLSLGPMLSADYNFARQRVIIRWHFVAALNISIHANIWSGRPASACHFTG